MTSNPLVRFLTLIVMLLPFTGRGQGDIEKARRLMEQSQEYILQKKYDKAEKYLLKSLEAAPSFTDAYSSLGFFYCEQNEYARAAEIFEKAAKNASAKNSIYRRKNG